MRHAKKKNYYISRPVVMLSISYPPLRFVREFCAHDGQRRLALARVRMRGAEDPPPPLDHVE